MKDVFDQELNDHLEDENENECGYCGTECEKEFCSEECFRADLND